MARFQKSFAVRQEEADWKLIEGLGSGGFSQPKRIKPEEGGPQGQLYDLAADPGEKVNLYGERPEILEKLQGEMAEIVAAIPGR